MEMKINQAVESPYTSTHCSHSSFRSSPLPEFKIPATDQIPLSTNVPAFNGINGHNHNLSAKYE
jgi:hypothetical protein